MPTYSGTTGSDVLNGSSGDDIFYAKAGADTINAKGGDDTIFGAGGKDTISGGSGGDLIFGGSGNDNIDGGSGNDEIWGGAGHDWIQTGTGSDRIYFGNNHGDDVVSDIDLNDDTLYLTGNIQSVSSYVDGSVDPGPDGIWNNADDTYAMLMIETGEGSIGLPGAWGYYAPSAVSLFIVYE